ncbi:MULTISPECIES: PilZ domain-containing protein [Sphingomonas]|uniref:PilZ domain-containing protein n=2 Tax=Sphingomonas TaxID=13687 RepID=A0ABU8H620_9SPHN|nr:PilZ domain-containing protein [Sphingomonas sp. CV7422]
MPSVDPTPYPAWLAQEERQADRLPVSWPSTISSLKFDEEPCTICDVTHLGCRVLLDRRVTVGTYVTIAMPQLTKLEGWIAWNRGHEVGVEFSHPLPASILDDIETRLRAGPPH